DHFGKLIEDLQGAEDVKWISKGLQLRIDSTNIYADSAVIYGEDRVFAYGNVVIQQGDSLEVFTDTLYYTRETDIAELVGEVALRQGNKQLWTTDLSYHLGERFGEYHQGGTLIDKDLQMSSKRGIYYAKDEDIVFKDSVIVLHPKFNLAADSMTYQAALSKVKFTGPTNIYTRQAKIYCESGFYDVEKETAEFNDHAQYVGESKHATADTIRYETGSGDVEMSGNVHVVERNRWIEGTQLRYSEKTGETWIKGVPAIYSDSTRKILSPEIFYNEKTKQVSTIGAGVIADGNQVTKADQFKYDDVTGRGKAEGHVMWSDTASHYGIHADAIDYSKKDEYVLAYGKTRPLFFTVVEGDTLFIAADTLNMWRIVDSLSLDTMRMIRAYRDVRLFKSDMQGRTDSLVFQGRDSIFHFFGRPVLWSDTTQFSADSIDMALRNKKIHSITLTHEALIVSELYHQYYDQIKGKLIVAQFDSSEIHDMWVNGNAESIYYSQDDHNAFIGVNKTICSNMYFTFDGGKIRILKYFGENTSSMLPMHETDHKGLRLDGFEWRPLERPWSILDLLR
ncbi:MAG TPA: OstA-like protein, partial [Saprospiraceae bacterium]|nr:OstA-like protein [Saprospiraceae bacterium]